VGIGRPKGQELSNDEDEIVRYVLGDFQPEEKAIIDKLIPCVSEAIDCLLREGLTATMNKFNGTDVRT
jgi:peptidyl-tRNA hydrolase